MGEQQAQFNDNVGGNNGLGGVWNSGQMGPSAGGGMQNDDMNELVRIRNLLPEFDVSLEDVKHLDIFQTFCTQSFDKGMKKSVELRGKVGISSHVMLMCSATSVVIRRRRWAVLVRRVHC